MTIATSLPWIGETTEDRWFRTRIQLTAKASTLSEKGPVKQGVAEIIYVLRGGEILQVKWPDDPMSIRIPANDYDIAVIETVDNYPEKTV